MAVLRNIAIAVFAISLITFIALFGQLPALRRTPIGWLQRLFCITVPNGLRRADASLTGGQITLRTERLGHYLFNEKNPLVLLLFLLLLTGSATLFLWQTLQQLPTSLVLPIPVLLALPYIFTYLCVSYKAHYITLDNHNDRMDDFPYDHTIFRPRTSCKTCHFAKPARSKHCSLCGFCVAKCDHHCPWVNNCLGLGNYRYFLALLLSLSALQFYGAYLSWWILSPYLALDPTLSLFSLARVENIGHAFVIAINRGGISVAGVGLLAASTAFLPLGLLVYHSYLIWAGMTTNESQKWTDWKDDMADGYVFKASRSQLRAHNRARKATAAEAGRYNAALDAFEDDDGLPVKWPNTSDQVLVRTRDGRPPHGQEPLWDRIWSVGQIDNLYDLGGLQNLSEVIRGR